MLICFGRENIPFCLAQLLLDGREEDGREEDGRERMA